jgi:hypothetical protein
LINKYDPESGTFVNPGQSWTTISTATAVSPGTFTLYASSSFEVHIDYPWPAYWGLETASKEITITP